MVWYGMYAWHGTARQGHGHGTARHGMAWHGIVCMVWYGMYGMVGR